MFVTLLLLAVFGVAMAHCEGVVVVYLRQVLNLTETDLNHTSAGKFSPAHLRIERTREAATIVMLVVIAWLAGTTWLEKGLFFLWTFAFWDLFYYLSLYLLIKWPPSLKTMDLLFLIPAPWVAPVWFPIGVSLLTILIIALWQLL
jgi:hypothetical protein